MRDRFLAAMAVAVAMVLVPASAPGQSLAEIAKKQKQRRKSVKSSKVYTERDLRAQSRRFPTQPSTTPSSSSSEAEASTPAAGAEEKTPEQIQQESQKEWREKLDKAAEEVTQLTEQIASVQGDLNNLTGNLYSATRTRQLNRLEQLQQSLAAARQRVEDLQNEGRRSRFRP